MEICISIYKLYIVPDGFEIYIYIYILPKGCNFEICYWCRHFFQLYSFGLHLKVNLNTNVATGRTEIMSLITRRKPGCASGPFVNSSFTIRVGYCSYTAMIDRIVSNDRATDCGTFCVSGLRARAHTHVHKYVCRQTAPMYYHGILTWLARVPWEVSSNELSN